VSGRRKGISERTFEIRKAIVAESQEPIELAEIHKKHGEGMRYDSFYQQYFLMKGEGVMECAGLMSKGRTRSVVVKALVETYKSEHYTAPKEPKGVKKEKIKREGNVTTVSAGVYHTGQGKKVSPRVYIGSTMGML